MGKPATKTAGTPKPMPKVIRTSAGLRSAVFDELDRIRNGESTPTVANAISRLSDTIIKTVEMEIEVHKHLAKMPTGIEKTRKLEFSL